MQASGYNEEYKRVFFRDIRYLVARKTPGQAIQASVSGALVVAMMLLNLTRAPWWVPDVLALPFLVWFVLNWMGGSTCQCFASTDVQTLELPAPRRFAKLPALVAFLNARVPTEAERAAL